MNTLFKSFFFFSFLTLLITPIKSKAEYFSYYFDPIFYLPPIIIQPTIPYQYSFTNFTGITIDNLGDQALTIDLGFNPDLGLDLNTELVQPGFLLLDGTLALTVNPVDTTSGRTADIRTEYRVGIDPRALGTRAINELIRWQLGRDSGRIGARARISDARLMRFNEESGTWIRAVDAIQDLRAVKRNMGNSSPDGILGHYGYNEADSYVWAVLDTNSKYAAGLNLDHDGDGIVNSGDNCPYVTNTDQINSDTDEYGDACDNDDDNDGIADDIDNCPLFANIAQTDWDGDGIGDTCDFDDDNDAVNDGLDLCLYTEPAAVVNSEGCSIVDLCECDNEWKNHGSYVRCVAHAAENFVEDQLITEADKDYIVSEAAQSSCGQKQ